MALSSPDAASSPAFSILLRSVAALSSPARSFTTPLVDPLIFLPIKTYIKFLNVSAACISLDIRALRALIPGRTAAIKPCPMTDARDWMFKVRRRT